MSPAVPATVGTTTTHYQDDDGNPVADPNRSIAEKPNKPVRDVVKKINGTIKKMTERLRPNVNELTASRRACR